ncbi:MAG: ARMT1-like domain-containing protein [Methanoregulaceae archaeon]|nr:ARMT1-like domain-containing protein [Methanoregulaceae archaeon]
MKFDDRCVDCLLSRVMLECRLCGATDSRSEEVIAACAALIEELRGRPLLHPQIASAMHRKAYAMLGSDDPFLPLKEESDRIAREVCRAERGRLSGFRDFVLASIIGNTFDYGVKGHQVTGDFLGYFEQEFAAGLAIDDTDRIYEKIDRVVYFTDNCGEIVFDRLLLEYLYRQGSRITLAVREMPVLNDATMAEARALHLDRFADTLTTTGCGCELGVRLDCMPPELSKAVEDCTLIIAKGMANYESLSEYNGLPPVAFLMAAKCDPIAEEVGVRRGSKVAMLRDRN